MYVYYMYAHTNWIQIILVSDNFYCQDFTMELISNVNTFDCRSSIERYRCRMSVEFTFRVTPPYFLL